MDEEQKKVLDLAIENVKECGVATMNTTDGQYFLFRRDKLVEMIAACDKSERDYAMVHVKIPGKYPV